MKNKIITILLLAIMLCCLLWGHHMFMSGVNPLVSNIFVIPLTIIFLIGIFYFSKKSGLKTSRNVATLFSISFILLLILSVVNYFLWGNSAIDIQIHDTYYVIAYFQILALFSLLFGVYAMLYNFIPKITTRKLNGVLGKFHFWSTTIGVLLFIFQTYYPGVAGVPRRYYSENINAYTSLESAINLLSIIIILIVFSQLIFLANLIYSQFKSPKIIKA